MLSTNRAFVSALCVMLAALGGICGQAAAQERELVPLPEPGLRHDTLDSRFRESPGRGRA